MASLNKVDYINIVYIIINDLRQIIFYRGKPSSTIIVTIISYICVV